MERIVKPYRVHGGARVPHRKNTAHAETRAMPAPVRVLLPMQQHVGAPCEPLVKKGDRVLVGQKIADSGAAVSAPIHASVSGTVAGVEKVLLPGGRVSDAIVIDSDGSMEPDPSLRPPKAETLEEFLAAVRESGLVGLGGAGFPAHVKLRVPAGKAVDTLILNGAECEPYITSDHREALEHPQDVVEGARLVQGMLGIPRVILAVEDNKPDAIAALRAAAGDAPGFAVLPLRSRYPQGAEKVLVKACTNRKIPLGKLPADAGCIVMNITSAGFLARYFRTGMPLVQRRITVDGSAIQNPANVLVPVGTRIRDVVAFLGGYRGEPRKLLMGGPMMGLALPDDGAPVLKQNNGILAFDGADAKLPEPSACIRCGRCVAGCPMNLEPLLLEQLAEQRDAAGLARSGVAACMECGTCAYRCPAHRPLMQAIRLGKNLVKQAGGKN